MDTPASDGSTPNQAVDSSKDTSTHSWRDALPVELRNNDLIKGYQKPGDLVNDYIKVKGESANAIRIPGEGASAEEKAAYYAKLGRPEKPEGYEFTKPEGLPEGMFNAKLAEDFAKFLHERGAPKALAQDIYKFYNQMVMDGNKTFKDQETQKEAAEKQKTDEGINKLKNEWIGDKFAVNTAIATEAFKKFSDEEAIKFLETTKVDGILLGNHPQFLKLFYEIGKLTKDDSALIRKEGAEGNLANTEEAKANIMYPSMVKKAG